MGTGSIRSTNPVADSGGSLEIAFDPGEAIFTGTIQDNVSLVKSGLGQQVLTGNNTYTGTTTVVGGTLQVDGSHNGGEQYTVSADGTLGGNGSIGSAVIVRSGGRLAPGASAGSLSVDEVMLSSGAFFEAEIGGTTAGSQYDQLNVASSAVLGGTLQVSMLDSNGAAYEPSSSETFTILSGGSVSGSFDNVEGGERIETLGGEGTFLVTYGGGSVLLSGFQSAQELDFGDAPDSYATLQASGGASHIAIGPQLGLSRDVEIDGAPSGDADGDGGDEDGVLFGGIGVNSSVAAVNIELDGATEGRIDAWIDFDRNGVFDEDERILNSELVNTPLRTINYALPSGLTSGDAYARVRISSAGGLSPTGLAADGEVEDYAVHIGEAPTVESVVINGGEAQRSSVDSVEITFDRIIDVSDGESAFSVVHESGDLVPAIPAIRESGGKTVVNLTFDPDGVHVTSSGSLADGDYQLVINASQVTAEGVELDGNLDGTTGDNYLMSAVDGFFRKYGDQTGDDGVGLGDFAAFRSSFGKSHGDSGYLHGLDSDGDGEIGLTVFAAFRQNFGR